MARYRPLSFLTGTSSAFRWTCCIAGAVLLHLGIVTPLILHFGHDAAPPAEPPEAAMTVELAPPAATPQQKMTEIPLGVDQVEHRIQPKPQPDPPPFDPPPEIKTSPPPDALATRPKDPEPRPVTMAAADQTTAAPSSLAKPAKALSAPVLGAPSDTASNPIQTWENQLLAHLERQKRYPSSALAQRQEDVVYLRFVMDRDGKVLRGGVWRSHGYVALDAEVNALIKRASPLPRPPDSIGGSTIEMVVPVEFYLHRELARH